MSFEKAFEDLNDDFYFDSNEIELIKISLDDTNVIANPGESPSASSVSKRSLIITDNDYEENRLQSQNKERSKKKRPGRTNNTHIAFDSAFDFMKSEIEQKRSSLSRSDFIKYLFPGDLTLAYGRILIDAFNVGYTEHLANALSAFCIPECSIGQYSYGYIKNPFGIVSRDFHGLANISLLFKAYSIACPDLVLTIGDYRVKIIDKMPANFVALLNMQKETLKLCDTSNIVNNEVCKKVPCSQSRDTKKGAVIVYYIKSSGTKLQDICVDKTINSDGAEMTSIKIKPSDCPYFVKVSLHGYFVVALNKMGKITRFEFHSIAMS